MDKKELTEKIETIKQSVEQMKIDDLEDNPEMAVELFQCDCCGQDKIFAGSLIYNTYRLCNDCVLLAEVSFALNKITEIEELMGKMDDKRFEVLYDSIFNLDENSMN